MMTRTPIESFDKSSEISAKLIKAVNYAAKILKDREWDMIEVRYDTEDRENEPRIFRRALEEISDRVRERGYYCWTEINKLGNPVIRLYVRYPRQMIPNGCSCPEDLNGNPENLYFCASPPRVQGIHPRFDGRPMYMHGRGRGLKVSDLIVASQKPHVSQLKPADCGLSGIAPCQADDAIDVPKTESQPLARMVMTVKPIEDPIEDPIESLEKPDPSEVDAEPLDGVSSRLRAWLKLWESPRYGCRAYIRDEFSKFHAEHVGTDYVTATRMFWDSLLSREGKFRIEGERFRLTGKGWIRNWVQTIRDDPKIECPVGKFTIKRLAPPPTTDPEP